MTTVTLPPGHTLTVTADAVSAGNVWPYSEHLGDTAGVSEVAASASVTLGPFAIEKRYLIEATSGSLSTSIAAVDFNSPSEDTAAIAAAVASLKRKMVTGGAAGDLTLTGIAVGDSLVAVIQFVGAGTAVTDIADLTAEFTIAANKINNTGGTNTTGSKLLVLYNDLT